MKISAKLIKELRAKTGVGMMQCKKALQDSGGDVNKAVEMLRKWNVSSTCRGSNLKRAEGIVASYIHTGGRVGVLVEVNCETDFVAYTPEFQSLVRDIAMQIAACPSVKYVKVSDIPAEIVEKETEIEMGWDDLANIPDNVQEKIVQGRIEKRLKELCLMDQLYIRDQSIVVEELVNQAIAKLGENIQVRRFTRYVLGERIAEETLRLNRPQEDR
ncbi:MAG TPA: translation elongation factor Ts [Coleofasciculaceae cyanobacterium]